MKIKNTITATKFPKGNTQNIITGNRIVVPKI